MPKVLIPPPYRGPTQGIDSLEVEGASVRACIDAVEAAHPGFSAQVFDATGAPHKFVRLFVNGEPADPESPVSPADELEIVAAIAGG